MLDGVVAWKYLDGEEPANSEDDAASSPETSSREATPEVDPSPAQESEADPEVPNKEIAEQNPTPSRSNGKATRQKKQAISVAKSARVTKPRAKAPLVTKTKSSPAKGKASVAVKGKALIAKTKVKAPKGNAPSKSKDEWEMDESE
jgi:hypothetical protein